MNAIGVIGQGFVGTAVREGFRRKIGVWTYDKKEPNLLHFYNGEREQSQQGGLAELVDMTDGPIFVCVPTPMRKDGSCDTSIVGGVVNDIEQAVGHEERPTNELPSIVIKSTVPPNTTARMNQSPYVNVCFNPEFLREVSPNEDFKNQDRIVLGGSHYATARVRELYEMAFPGVPIVVIDSSTAEMVKYVTNCFLATKVSFANEMSQVCEWFGIDYGEMIEVAKLDKRLGDSHWAVPGPDGHWGFGGSCFVKDLNGMIRFGFGRGVSMTVMQAAWEKNLEVRPERDWEKLKGRAVQ